jgi:modulator of FtsH protease
VIGWDNFFVAQAGAAAAFAGLLFVALSMNLRQILATKHLPGRAGETLVMLGILLIIALLGLVPGQGTIALGVELVACGALAIVVPTLLQIRGHNPLYDYRFNRIVTNQVPAALIVTAGVMLLVDRSPMVWIASGVVLAFLGAVINAWVLLVEIQR